MKLRANSIVKIDTGNVNMDYTFPKGASVLAVIKNLAQLYSDIEPNGIEQIKAVVESIGKP
jgi:hypothetical protein